MSWIRDHFTHFVIPALRSMIAHRDQKPKPRDVKPLDKLVRPAAVCKYTENGLVYATIASMLTKRDPRREKLLELCRTLQPSEFTGPDTVKLALRADVPGADIVHSIVWNSLRALKRRARKCGGPMILPGRDVWPWEVISRRQRLSTVFDSRVSREVARRTDVVKPIAEAWPVPDWDRSLVFDTGWNGSIHSLLCKATGKKPASYMLSAEEHVRDMQLFPGHTGARAKAIAIEHFPKYFDRAVVQEKEVVQEFESLENFVKTALLTIWLWHYVSPRKIAALKNEAEVKKLLEQQQKHKMQIQAAPATYKYTGGILGSGNNFGKGYISTPTGGYLSASTFAPILNTSITTNAATIPVQFANTGVVYADYGGWDQSVIAQSSAQMIHEQQKAMMQKLASLANQAVEGGEQLKNLWGEDGKKDAIKAAIEDAYMLGQTHAIQDPASQLHKWKGQDIGLAPGQVTDYYAAPPEQTANYVDPNTVELKQVPKKSGLSQAAQEALASVGAVPVVKIKAPSLKVVPGAIGPIAINTKTGLPIVG